MARTFIGLSLAEPERLPVPCTGCMYWQSAEPQTVECGAACDDDAATAWMRRVIAEWGECGRAAVTDGEVLGFIRYAPPVYFPQSMRMPAGPPDPDVVLISCMHIAPEARRRGLGGLLLREAMRDLASRGERSAQAYASANRGDFELVPMVGVDFLLRHGFTVSRPHPVTPLLRVDLKALASWAENLEGLLESLRIPLGAPRRAPATLSTSRGER